MTSPRPELQPFADLITTVRAERGWTRVELAKRLGVHPTLPGYWERATTEPTDVLLVGLCRLLETPVTEVAATLPRYRDMDMERSAVGKAIVLARWAVWESQAEFSRRVGVKMDALRTWERGTSQPTDRNLAALAEAVEDLEALVRENPPSTPAPYMGTKAQAMDQLLAMVPVTSTFVEPFGGSGAVLFAREPVKVEVYNDVDHRLATLFGALRDPEAARRLKERLELTLYSRAEHQKAVRFLKARGGTAEDVAWAMFVLLGQSKYGLGLEFESNWQSPIRPTAVRGWWKRVAWVDHWHERLANVAIECDDALAVIARYDSPTSTFYLDPPYPNSTTTRARVYANTFRRDDHARLVDALLGVEGAVVLAGYPYAGYERLERAGWERRRLRGKDHVWRNPAAVELAA